MTTDTERELGRLQSDVRHILNALQELKETARKADDRVSSRLEDIETRLDTLFNNRSLAMGALAVSCSVGGFVMWIIQQILGPILDKVH